MTIQDIITANYFTLKVPGDPTRTISTPFCCDLLSIAMSKAPTDSAWVTVMGNRNTLAVASLADVACIVLAEDVLLNETDLTCAQEQGITVFETGMPVFDAALLIYKLGQP